MSPRISTGGGSPAERKSARLVGEFLTAFPPRYARVATVWRSSSRLVSELKEAVIGNCSLLGNKSDNFLGRSVLSSRHRCCATTSCFSELLMRGAHQQF